MMASINTQSPGEFELIERYFVNAGKVDPGKKLPGVALGIGDDCALLEVPAGCQLAVSMDTLVAGVHFPVTAEVELLAERALRVNLSDLAAMGADPLWYTLALTLPHNDAIWLQAFAAGLHRVANEFGIALVGGDTTRGPLSITVQVHGSVPRGQALVRNGAAAGDRVFVSGPMGDGAAALAVMDADVLVDANSRDYLQARFYQPRPQLAVGRSLRGLASAAIDVSDGLLADLGHICRRSGVGAELQWSQIPLSETVRSLFPPPQQQAFALAGGDDYQLCFTVPEVRCDALRELVAKGALRVWEIGTITANTQVKCLDAGRPVALAASGYQHFLKDATEATRE